MSAILIGAVGSLGTSILWFVMGNIPAGFGWLCSAFAGLCWHLERKRYDDGLARLQQYERHIP